MNGSGTKFYRSDDGAVYTRVANILGLTPAEETRTSIEKAYLDVDNNVKNFEPGMIDPGSVTLNLEFDSNDAAQNALKADKNTKANFFYRIEYPDGSTDDFQGFITNWGKTVEAENTIQRTVTFKVSGAIDEVPAA